MLKVFKNLKKRDILFMCICAALVVLQVWLELTMPDYTQKLTELVSMGNGEMSQILYNGGFMLLCAVCSMIAAMICGFFAAQVAANFAKTLRERLFNTIMGFGNDDINKFSTPSLITRTTNDVVQMQMLIAMGLQMLIKAPIMAIWAICKISATDIKWTLATAVTVIIMFIVILIILLVAFPKFKRMQIITDNLNDVTRENISGVRVIRAFNAEDYQENKFEKVNVDFTKTNLFTMRAMGVMIPVLSLCMSGLTLAIYWIGAYIINDAPLMDRAVQMGNMTAFTQYAMQIVMSFIMLVVIFVMLPRTMVSGKRISEVLDTKSSIKYKDEEKELKQRGTVEFKNVSFGYKGATEKSIENVSFSIKQGETFAIIGATGSGKSTIVNLIPRFYDATEGEVLIDGVDIRDIPEAELEAKISIAPQKAILFRGDIKSNITYGAKREVSDTDEKLLQAIKTANADFIYELDNGLHAHVAQGGTNFSGGQKQRLSIARTVFKDAEIAIFDDTFSALDYKTDMLVRKEIKKNMRDTTVIIVAQRIGTIMNADKIMVLDEGRVVDIGTHEELLKNCSVYREIALSQLSKEEL